MSGPTPIRDPLTDHLITPQNAAIAFIDYQPEQYAGVGSIDTKSLLAGELQRDWGREDADKLRAALGGYFGPMP